MSSPPSMNINCAKGWLNGPPKGKFLEIFLHLPQGLVAHSPAQTSATRWAGEIKLILPTKQTIKNSS